MMDTCSAERLSPLAALAERVESLKVDAQILADAVNQATLCASWVQNERPLTVPEWQLLLRSLQEVAYAAECLMGTASRAVNAGLAARRATFTHEGGVQR